MSFVPLGHLCPEHCVWATLRGNICQSWVIWYLFVVHHSVSNVILPKKLTLVLIRTFFSEIVINSSRYSTIKSHSSSQKPSSQVTFRCFASTRHADEDKDCHSALRSSLVETRPFSFNLSTRLLHYMEATPQEGQLRHSRRVSQWISESVNQ